MANQNNIPTSEAKEAPETTIKNLQEENEKLKSMLQQLANENQILRATVKALSQLI